MCRVIKHSLFIFFFFSVLDPGTCIGQPSGHETLRASCYQWMADQKASLTAPWPIAFWLNAMNTASNANIVFSETQEESKADITISSAGFSSGEPGAIGETTFTTGHISVTYDPNVTWDADGDPVDAKSYALQGLLYHEVGHVFGAEHEYSGCPAQGAETPDGVVSTMWSRGNDTTCGYDPIYEKDHFSTPLATDTDWMATTCFPSD